MLPNFRTGAADSDPTLRLRPPRRAAVAAGSGLLPLTFSLALALGVVPRWRPGRLAGPRRADQIVQQVAHRVGHVVYRLVEHGLVGLRRHAVARHLAYELEGSGPDLVIGGRGLAPESHDAAAHGSITIR